VLLQRPEPLMNEVAVGVHDLVAPGAQGHEGTPEGAEGRHKFGRESDPVVCNPAPFDPIEDREQQHGLVRRVAEARVSVSVQAGECAGISCQVVGRGWRGGVVRHGLQFDCRDLLAWPMNRDHSPVLPKRSIAPCPVW